MWALLSRRIRVWLMFAVGVPLLAWLFDNVAETLESSRGETQVTKGLRGGSHWLRRRQPGRGRRRGTAARR
jgi:hypothetical protein